MKKDKKKMSPVTISVIVAILGVVLIFGSIIYNSKHSIEEWVVCNYNGSIQGYKETIKFRYMYDTLYGYYEEKDIMAQSEDEKTKIEEQINEFGKDFPTSDDVKLEVTSEGLEVKSNFYIKTITYTNFIDDYFKEQEITMQSNSSDIVNKLKSDYECKITRK